MLDLPVRTRKNIFLSKKLFVSSPRLPGNQTKKIFFQKNLFLSKIFYIKNFFHFWDFTKKYFYNAVLVMTHFGPEIIIFNRFYKGFGHFGVHSKYTLKYFFCFTFYYQHVGSACTCQNNIFLSETVFYHRDPPEILLKNISFKKNLFLSQISPFRIFFHFWGFTKIKIFFENDMYG